MPEYFLFSPSLFTVSMFVLECKWVSLPPKAKRNVFPTVLYVPHCENCWSQSPAGSTQLESKISWAMFMKSQWHDETREPLNGLQPLRCAPPWMEKEWARISKKYSFSITHADNWLREGLWFDSREREKEREKKQSLLDQMTAESLTTYCRTWPKSKKRSQRRFQRKI